MLRTPFFTVNPKSYLYGEELLQLALKADELAKKYDIDIFFTAPLIELGTIIEKTSYIIPTAQHMDEIGVGVGMGYASPEILAAKGVKATFLNHAEHQVETSKLVKTVKKARELGIMTLLCADSIEEARALAMLNPTIMLCEPTDLIGTGKTSDDSYVQATNSAVKEVNSDVFVLQAAGISTADDVSRMFALGADGTGATSGIVASKDPVKTLEEMIEASVASREDK